MQITVTYTYYWTTPVTFSHLVLSWVTRLFFEQRFRFKYQCNVLDTVEICVFRETHKAYIVMECGLIFSFKSGVLLSISFSKVLE